jgi:SAM-dependent methyltransferase
MRLLLAAILLAATLALGCGGAEGGAPAARAAADTTDSVYTYRTPSRDGIGKVYLGREIAQVMGHRGAGWLERDGRAAAERPDLVLDGLGLDPTDDVADIGAGTGYFTFRLAPLVPRGTVYAVDIQPEMLAMLRERMAERGVTNVVPVRGTVRDPNLPPGSIDLALMVDAYHEFSHPRAMMQGLHAALRPGGRIALVEYRAHDPSVRIKPLHTMTEAQAVKEMRAVGLRHLETIDLPKQRLMLFGKDDAG